MNRDDARHVSSMPQSKRSVDLRYIVKEIYIGWDKTKESYSTGRRILIIVDARSLEVVSWGSTRCKNFIGLCRALFRFFFDFLPMLLIYISKLRIEIGETFHQEVKIVWKSARRLYKRAQLLLAIHHRLTECYWII